MSIIRLYRAATLDDGTRLLEYREAWALPGQGEVVVHFGRVGQPGTTREEKVADDAAAADLLDGFAAQSAEDGFAPLDEDRLETVVVSYRLKGAAPTAVEVGLLERLAGEITHRLAWRGLGEVTETGPGESGQVLLTVRTPHAAKAAREIPAAAKQAGVQTNRVEVL